MTRSRMLTLAGLAVLAVAALAGAADTPRFDIDASWPKPLPNNWIFGQIAGIYIDKRDNVWIIQRPRTVNERDKRTVTPILRRFLDLGFKILATGGTYRYLTRLGIECEQVFKVGEGRPDIVDRMVSGEVQLLINTPLGKKSQFDDYAMRRAAITYKVPYLTTMSATSAACDALIALRTRVHQVTSLQERIGRSRQTDLGI